LREAAKNTSRDGLKERGGNRLSEGKEILLFSGTANPELSEKIAANLGLSLGGVKISRFSNGEIYIRFQESVRGGDIYVIQSLSNNVNDALMELLIMIDALKRASAETITAVIPHYGYARQDKKSKAREPITAKLIADILTVAGISRLATVDLHADSIQGFYNVPVDHLTAMSIISKYFKEKNLKDLIVVSPDVGRVKTAKKFSDTLGADLAILHKSRPKANVAEITHVVGDVAGKVALIVDDMIDTAGTICEAAKAVIQNGAVKAYAAATHPILSGPAIQRLKEAPFEEVVLTDTIPISKDKMLDKFTVLSTAPLLAKMIENIHCDKSVSTLFE
jgi:ribose-phosphate pyrophosphokinase